MSSILVRESIFISILLYLMESQAMPIHNGFSVKFNPVMTKEEIRPKTFGALFAKVPQEVTPQAAHQVLSQTIFPQVADLGLGCTNQIARLLHPLGSYLFNHTEIREKSDQANVSALKQPIEGYKVIVAKAPKNFKIGKSNEAQQIIIYIVFSEDDGNHSDTINIPKIYFVHNADVKKVLAKVQNVDPVIIVNSNRTVTGLRSTEISKYVKFKNKLTNRIANKLQIEDLP